MSPHSSEGFKFSENNSKIEKSLKSKQLIESTGKKKKFIKIENKFKMKENELNKNECKLRAVSSSFPLNRKNSNSNFHQIKVSEEQQIKECDSEYNSNINSFEISNVISNKYSAINNHYSPIFDLESNMRNEAQVKKSIVNIVSCSEEEYDKSACKSIQSYLISNKQRISTNKYSCSDFNKGNSKNKRKYILKSLAVKLLNSAKGNLSSKSRIEQVGGKSEHSYICGNNFNTFYLNEKIDISTKSFIGNKTGKNIVNNKCNMSNLNILNNSGFQFKRFAKEPKLEGNEEITDNLKILDIQFDEDYLSVTKQENIYDYESLLAEEQPTNNLSENCLKFQGDPLYLSKVKSVQLHIKTHSNDCIKNPHILNQPKSGINNEARFSANSIVQKFYKLRIDEEEQFDGISRKEILLNDLKKQMDDCINIMIDNNLEYIIKQKMNKIIARFSELLDINFRKKMVKMCLQKGSIFIKEKNSKLVNFFNYLNEGSTQLSKIQLIAKKFERLILNLKIKFDNICTLTSLNEFNYSSLFSNFSFFSRNNLDKNALIFLEYTKLVIKSHTQRNLKLIKLLQLDNSLVFDNKMLKNFDYKVYIYETIRNLFPKFIKFDLPKSFKLINLCNPEKVLQIGDKKLKYFRNGIVETADNLGNRTINYNDELELHLYSNGDKLQRFANNDYMIYLEQKCLLIYRFNNDKCTLSVNYKKKKIEFIVKDKLQIIK